jgi:hypothetical protein
MPHARALIIDHLVELLDAFDEIAFHAHPAGLKTTWHFWPSPSRRVVAQSLRILSMDGSYRGVFYARNPFDRCHDLAAADRRSVT